MKTIEYDPNSYNTALDELAAALRAGEKINVIPVDPYQEYKDAEKAGKTIEITGDNGETWESVSKPGYVFPAYNYRIKPDTVKMWQWVYRSQIGHVRSTSEFFRSQEGAAELYPHVTLLQRADWTEIYVEVDQ